MTPLPPRTPGWRGRLFAWLAEIATLEHRYGSHDCALFGSGVVLAMHGIDPAAPWRGRYTTWRGGLRILRQAGYRDHIDVVRHLGHPVAPGFEQIGDLVAVDAPGHAAIGVVTGSTISLLRPEGLATLPMVVETVGITPEATRIVKGAWRT